MSRKIDLQQDSFTEEEANYLRQRPWMLDDGLRQRLGDKSDDEEEEGETGISYEEMSNTDLRRLLKSRDLDFSKANKEELVARLEMADAEAEE